MRTHILNIHILPMRLICRSVPSLSGNLELPLPTDQRSIHTDLSMNMQCHCSLHVTLLRLCRILERRHERRYCNSWALQWSDRRFPWHFRSCQPCFVGSSGCQVIDCGSTLFHLVHLEVWRQVSSVLSTPQPPSPHKPMLTQHSIVLTPIPAPSKVHIAAMPHASPTRDPHSSPAVDHPCRRA